MHSFPLPKRGYYIYKVNNILNVSILSKGVCLLDISIFTVSIPL